MIYMNDNKKSKAKMNFEAIKLQLQKFIWNE